MSLKRCKKKINDDLALWRHINEPSLLASLWTEYEKIASNKLKLCSRHYALSSSMSARSEQRLASTNRMTLFTESEVWGQIESDRRVFTCRFRSTPLDSTRLDSIQLNSTQLDPTSRGGETCNLQAKSVRGWVVLACDNNNNNNNNHANLAALANLNALTLSLLAPL